MTYDKEGQIEKKSRIEFQTKHGEAQGVATKLKVMSRMRFLVWLAIAVASFFLPDAEIVSITTSFFVVILPYVLGKALVEITSEEVRRSRSRLLMLLCVVSAINWGEGCGVLIRSHVMPAFEALPLLSPLASLAPLSEVMACVFCFSSLFSLLANKLDHQVALADVTTPKNLSKPTHQRVV